MSSVSTYLNPLLFAALPYMALIVFFIGTIWRYTDRGFSYSSLSSQFLENKKHFWGLVPFHYGLITILVGHLIGLLVPRGVLLWNSEPLRLYILEVAALIGGLFALVGMILIIERRLTDPKIKIVTTRADWIVYIILLCQILTGVLTAIMYPWGSSWFAAAASPYLWSIIKLNPDISYIAAMPHLVKTHIVLAYILVGFFPFSRLVHILVVPNQYLWRRPQVVRWYRDWIVARAR
jgi:nitrate reductase gamma subunit